MASKISGVGVHTIRAWEKRYNALAPNRDTSGHRTYTKTDIEKLMLLSELCLLGYTISKVAKLEIPDLKNLLKDLGKSEESIESHEFNLVKEKPLIDARQSQNILLFALKNYKLDVINQEIEKLKYQVGPREMAMDIILPLALELKELQARGEYTATQQQTLSALLCFHANTPLFRHNERRDRSSVNVVVAGLEGDHNDLFLVIAGLLCTHYGFNHSFLGSNLAVDSLSDSLNFLNANMLVLNASNASVQFGLSHVQGFVEKLMAKVPAHLDTYFLGKSDLHSEKIPAKRFLVFKSIEALDEALSKKSN